jgi:hypothetical protein
MHIIRNSSRLSPSEKKQVHLGKDARSSDVLHFVCFGEETWNSMHFLVILSLKTLWAGVKRWRTALHRFRYTGTPNSSPVIKKMCTFEVLLFCVWCLDNWSRILSGKPFNTFSMARLKTLQFIWPSLPFSLPRIHYIFSLSPFFHHDLWLVYLVYPPLLKISSIEKVF